MVLARNSDGGLTVMFQPLKPLDDLACDCFANCALAMRPGITGVTADIKARLPALLMTHAERSS